MTKHMQRAQRYYWFVLTPGTWSTLPIQLNCILTFHSLLHRVLKCLLNKNARLFHIIVQFVRQNLLYYSLLLLLLVLCITSTVSNLWGTIKKLIIHSGKCWRVVFLNRTLTNFLRFVPSFLRWTIKITNLTFVSDEDEDESLIERNIHTGMANPGDPWQTIPHNGLVARFIYRIRVRCDENYYSSKCNKLCVPRDDYFGHYRCEPSGTQVCLDGWMGPGCTTGEMAKASENVLLSWMLSPSLSILQWSQQLKGHLTVM